jgi:hypothetical protein
LTGSAARAVRRPDMICSWPSPWRPTKGVRDMPASEALNDTDKVIHIIGTYDLSMSPEMLESIRRSVGDSTRGNGDQLSEERAAVVLARYLYALVIAELHSGNDAGTSDGILDVWARFTQQAMYRSDLGLIKMALFDEEILPLIDEAERIFREQVLNRKEPRPHMRGVGVLF